MQGMDTYVEVQHFGSLIIILKDMVHRVVRIFEG